VIGRPKSAGINLMIFVAWGVNRRTLRSLSKKSVAISVLLSRFFMSRWPATARPPWPAIRCSRYGALVHRLHLLLRGREFFVVDCISSLVDCSSSLADRSSSWEVCISSWVARASPRTCAVPAPVPPARADEVRLRRPTRRLGDHGRRHVGEDDHNHPCNGPGSSSRCTVTSTHCSPPLVPTLSP